MPRTLHRGNRAVRALLDEDAPQRQRHQHDRQESPADAPDDRVEQRAVRPDPDRFSPENRAYAGFSANFV